MGKEEIRLKSNVRANCVLSEVLNHLRIKPHEPYPESLMQEFWDIMDKIMPHEEITVIVNIAKSKDSAIREIISNVRPEKRERVKHLCNLLYKRGYHTRRASEKRLITQLDRIIKNLEEK